MRFARLVSGFTVLALTWLMAVPLVASQQLPVVDEKPLDGTSGVHNGLNLALIGDTGSGASFQQAIAKQLSDYHQAHPLQGVLHMGDVIYPSGEVETHCDKLYARYYQSLWQAGAKFYPVLGNHDVRKGFRQALLTCYQMPSRYYRTQFRHQGVSVDAFAIDTNIANDKQQIAWLKQALASSQADWQVVYGHHPVLSSGLHGDSATMQQVYLPLFKQYGVDAYFAGHDHDYERFVSKDGVLLLVTGGGGAYLRHFPGVAAGSQVRLQAHHFVGVTFTKTHLRGETIDKYGKVIDRFSHVPH